MGTSSRRIRCEIIEITFRYTCIFLWYFSDSFTTRTSDENVGLTRNIRVILSTQILYFPSEIAH